MSGKRKRNRKNGIVIQNVSYNKKKKRSISHYLKIAVYVFVGLIIILGTISDYIPRNYYLKDIKILQGSIIQKECDAGKYYIKVSPTSYGGFTISDDNSWFEVQEGFYNKCWRTELIGVKFANADVYNPKFWGVFGNRGQTFEENVWYIDEVYNSINDANIENPTKRSTQQAIILKKKITKKGEYFFVINTDNKSMPVMVQKEIYNKYNVNDSLSCEFESIGDLTKFVKIT